MIIRLSIRLIICLLIISTKTNAAENNPIDNARSSALGDAGASLISSINPGTNTENPETSISVHYKNPYGIKELSTISANFLMSDKNFNYDIFISRFGYEKFNETRISASVSKKLSNRLSFGVRLNYYSILMSSLEDRKAMISSDIGFLSALNPKITVGIIGEHVLRTSYTTERGEFELPMALRLGINYKTTKECLLVGEISKSTDYDPIIKIGCEIIPVEDAAIRFGLMSSPMRPTFGVGYSPNKFEFDLASVYHSVLGFHTQFSMCYKF